MVGVALQDRSRRLNFRFVDGLAERVIFREFYPRGLSALDDVTESALGVRPTMSHATARLEVQGIVASILPSGLAKNLSSGGSIADVREQRLLSNRQSTLI